MSNQSIALSRRKTGQWASYIAGITLVSAILAWIWQADFSPVVIALLVIAAASTFLWAVVAPQDFKSFVTGRQVRFGTTAFFSTLLLVGIVVLVYIIVQRATLTLDMTEGRRFSLSQETFTILENVERDIQITGFYDASAVQLREVDDQFFRLYETATDGRISRRYINPDEEPALAQRFGAYSNGATFISHLTPEGEVDFNTLMRVPRQTGGAQEREMTRAIARLLNAGSIKVYFEIGRGSLDPLDESQQGLSGIHFGMQESGLITESLNLPALAASGQAIPDDASAIIMARPTTEPTAEEIALLDDYLNRGGSLLILADPIFSEGSFLSSDAGFNRYLWDNFGLAALNAVIVDYSANLRTPLDIIGSQVYTATEIGARLDPAIAPTLFRIARAINVSDDPPVNNGRVIVSSADSYGETDFRALAESSTFEPDPEVDPPGPLTSVAWAWDQETDGKILLAGDSDFITNGFVSSAPGNAILFTDAMAWLTGLNEQVNFSPQAFFSAPPLIFISTETLDLIAFVTVFLMPGIVLVSGLAVWVRRSRQ